MNNLRQQPPLNINSETSIRSWLIRFIFYTHLIIFLIYWLNYYGKNFTILVIKLSGKIVYTSGIEHKEKILHLLTPNFINISIGKIQNPLLKSSWISSVSVKRVCPNNLLIYLCEQIPLAKYSNRGVLTSTGELLYIQNVAKISHLPIFLARENKLKDMFYNYLILRKLLSPYAIKVHRLEIIPDQGWQAILNNGIILLFGQGELFDKLRRFSISYKYKLKEIIDKIHYIDLRYTNGIVIGWKTTINKSTTKVL